MSVQPKYVLRGHQHAVNCICLKRQHFVYSADCEGILKLWSLETRRVVDEVNLFHSVLSVSNIGENVISYTRDGIIRVWNASYTFAAGCTLEMHPNAPHFCNVATDPSGTLPSLSSKNVMDIDHFTIVSPSEDESKILLYDIRTNTSPTATFDTSSHSKKLGTVTALHYNAAESILIAGCENGSISAIDMKTGRTLSNMVLHDHHPIFGVDMCGTSIATVAADASIHQTTYSSSTLQHLHSVSWESEPGSSAVCYRNDGKLIASAHWDKSIRIHTAKKLKLVAQLLHHRDGVTAVEFIPMEYAGGAMLLSAAKDGNIAVWDIYRDNA